MNKSKGNKSYSDKIKRNKNKKSKYLKTGTILLIFFLLLYIPSIIHWINGNEVSTDIIRNGKIESTIDAKAVILRDETLISAPTTGVFLTNKNDGEKVGYKSIIAKISKISTNELTQKIDDIDAQILSLKKKLKSGQNVFSQDISRIEAEINSNLKEVIKSTYQNDFYRAFTLREEIDRLIYKKSMIYGSGSNSNKTVQALLIKKNNIENIINLNTINVYAKNTGIISYSIDGYERNLRPEKISELSPNIVDEINKKESGVNNIIKQEVKSGESFAKIISDKYFYICALLDKDLATNFNVDDYISRLKIKEFDISTNSRVVFKSAEENGKYMVVFRIDKYLYNLINMRTVNVSIVKQSYDGLKVPIKSLISVNFKNKTAKIAKVVANSVVITDIVVVGWNNEFAVITEDNKNIKNSKLALYDSYVVNPGKIKTGYNIP